MGENEKEQGQGGKEQYGEKPGYDQYDKGQQGQEGFDKGQSGGKEQFGEKPGYDQYDKGDQQQEFAKEPQRQQGDEDLGDDSIDNQSLK